jgi:hypothetical protein
VKSALLLLFGVVALTGCSKEDSSPDIVARVGDRMITMQELQRAYTLHPVWKRNQTVLASYLTQLEELQREKLYALEAEREGLDRDTLLQGYLRFLRQKELIKGLYRREVLGRVQIKEAEERAMYALQKKTVDAEFVMARDSVTCAMYARTMAGTSVEGMVLPPDSSVRVGKRSQMTVGTIPPPFERDVMNGDINVIIGPKPFGDVYMAMKVVNWTRNVFMSENEFQSDRARIDHLLRDRKADTLARAYVISMMKDSNLKLNGEVFWPLAGYFGKRVRDKQENPAPGQPVAVTSDELLLVQGDVRNLAQQVLATHREGTLTVWEFVSTLANMPGSMRPSVRTPLELKEAVGRVVRNQYFAREAERQGLGSDSEVITDFAQQRDGALSTAYYRSRRAKVYVTPEEVERFRKISGLTENEVTVRFNMTALAIDAKADSILRTEAPALEARYTVFVDSAKIRAALPAPDDRVKENPVAITVREIFQ